MPIEMKKLSQATIQKVKLLLPELRKEVKKGFLDWSEYTPGNNFHSDDKVLEYLPSAFYEYLIIHKKIYADREWVLYCLNHFSEENMREIIPHTLKRLAMLDYFSGLNEADKKISITKTRKRNKTALEKA